MTTATQGLREHLLAMLLEEPGRYLSGETLSANLHLTRAAIWKHMQALQARGWPIESVPRKGYRLPEAGRYPFSGAAVQALLRQTGDTFWRVSLQQEVDSTSTRLKEAAATGEPEGAVLIAETQTSGRGRLGRQWASLPGQGIWMSVLLRPDMAPRQVQALTLAASVSVVHALRKAFDETDSQAGGKAWKAAERVVADIGVKWPNDILWRGRKLCGILTELAAEPERLSHVVIGIGMNVSHQTRDFPPELRGTATSLAQVCKAGHMSFTPDRNHLAAHLLRELSRTYGLLCAGRLPDILNEWRHASVTLGRRIRVMDPEGDWEAEAMEIGEDGRLLVRREDGAERWLLSGEISIRPAGTTSAESAGSEEPHPR